ncbi:hypothetical protein E2562_019691 [Oryza meyeriana var. granulata]|uniref:FLZ-type domain-containing protein n=1 Tax=Oryza meyeriana var. granulata TaxID=110450 RepID=A0A6G1C6D5_9ORYZ|nr:hypothetical protein E2562_019691 [Oryza meyeriana var. granulata]
MAGLCVLLEKQHAAAAATTATAAARTAQIISKTTVLSTTGGKVVHGYSTYSSSSSRAPVAASSSFLHRCFLCRRELADGDDIYIYRGDRAFCSDECRCRHILMEEDGDMNCRGKDAVAAATRGRSRNRQAVAGGGFFEY